MGTRNPIKKARIEHLMKRDGGCYLCSSGYETKEGYKPYIPQGHALNRLRYRQSAYGDYMICRCHEKYMEKGLPGWVNMFDTLINYTREKDDDERIHEKS